MAATSLPPLRPQLEHFANELAAVYADFHGRLSAGASAPSAVAVSSSSGRAHAVKDFAWRTRACAIQAWTSLEASRARARDAAVHEELSMEVEDLKTAHALFMAAEVSFLDFGGGGGGGATGGGGPTPLSSSAPPALSLLEWLRANFTQGVTESQLSSVLRAIRGPGGGASGDPAVGIEAWDVVAKLAIEGETHDAGKLLALLAAALDSREAAQFAELLGSYPLLGSAAGEAAPAYAAAWHAWKARAVGFLEGGEAQRFPAFVRGHPAYSPVWHALAQVLAGRTWAAEDGAQNNGGAGAGGRGKAGGGAMDDDDGGGRAATPHPRGLQAMPVRGRVVRSALPAGGVASDYETPYARWHTLAMCVLLYGPAPPATYGRAGLARVVRACLQASGMPLDAGVLARGSAAFSPSEGIGLGALLAVFVRTLEGDPLAALDALPLYGQDWAAAHLAELLWHAGPLQGVGAAGVAGAGAGAGGGILGAGGSGGGWQPASAAGLIVAGGGGGAEGAPNPASSDSDSSSTSTPASSEPSPVRAHRLLTYAEGLCARASAAASASAGGVGRGGAHTALARSAALYAHAATPWGVLASCGYAEREVRYLLGQRSGQAGRDALASGLPLPIAIARVDGSAVPPELRACKLAILSGSAASGALVVEAALRAMASNAIPHAPGGPAAAAVDGEGVDRGVGEDEAGVEGAVTLARVLLLPEVADGIRSEWAAACMDALAAPPSSPSSLLCSYPRLGTALRSCVRVEDEAARGAMLRRWAGRGLSLLHAVVDIELARLTGGSGAGGGGAGAGGGAQQQEQQQQSLYFAGPAAAAALASALASSPDILSIDGAFLAVGASGLGGAGVDFLAAHFSGPPPAPGAASRTLGAVVSSPYVGEPMATIVRAYPAFARLLRLRRLLECAAVGWARHAARRASSSASGASWLAEGAVSTVNVGPGAYRAFRAAGYLLTSLCTEEQEDDAAAAAAAAAVHSTASAAGAAGARAGAMDDRGAGGGGDGGGGGGGGGGQPFRGPLQVPAGAAAAAAGTASVAHSSARAGGAPLATFGAACRALRLAAALGLFHVRLAAPSGAEAGAESETTEAEDEERTFVNEEEEAEEDAAPPELSGGAEAGPGFPALTARQTLLLCDRVTARAQARARETLRAAGVSLAGLAAGSLSASPAASAAIAAAAMESARVPPRVQDGELELRGDEEAHWRAFAAAALLDARAARRRASGRRSAARAAAHGRGGGRRSGGVGFGGGGGGGMDEGGGLHGYGEDVDEAGRSTPPSAVYTPRGHAPYSVGAASE